MPEYMRAFIAVMLVALPVLWLAKPPLCASVLEAREYGNLRLAWICTTCLLFLSGNFWVYVLLAAVALTVLRGRFENALLPYCALLFAAPPFLKLVPGVGPVEQIIGIDHYRLLALTLLLPAALQAKRAKQADIPASPGRMTAPGGRAMPPTSRWSVTDRFMLAFLAWLALVRVANDSVTGDVRGLIYLGTDAWLPYYVASRMLSSIGQVRKVIAAFCLAAAIVGCVAMAESVRLWLLYTPLAVPFDVGGTSGMYLVRSGGDGGGTLRAQASLGQPIALGYVLAVAIMLFSAIAARVPLLISRIAFFAAFAAGLVASMSRGPWSGAAAGLLSMLAVGRGASGRVVKFLVWGSGALALFALTPWASTVIAYLPFVGTVETGNIDYRTRLIDVSLELLGRNPLLGNFFFLKDPLLEQMRQGEGIVDMVNSYLQIALPYGCIGLALFAGIFLSVMIGLLRVCRRVEDPDALQTGRALFAALVAILVTIGTVSSISAIDKVYFLVAGLGAGYVRVAKAQLGSPVRPGRASRPMPAMAGSMV